MTDKLEALKSSLRAIVRVQEYSHRDPEKDHITADMLLLQYINDSEVSELFDSIYKWYA